ncbi:MAG TPA: AMP-binding protein [Rhizomicrobium sp.]|jgi:acyl-CoA synthetase (AMP-forming)/AMP-acid ligase II
MSGGRRIVPGFAADIEGWGDTPALIREDGVSISYRQFADMADVFAASLPDDVRLLAIEARSCVEALVAYLGALRSNRPVILHSGGVAADHILDRYQPDANYALDGPGGSWRLTITPTPWQSAPHPDLALLLSTSGSAGSPKLVRLSGAALDANARSIAAYLGLSAADRAVTNLPLSYSYGLSVLNSHLAVGGSIVLTELRVADPAFRDLLQARGVTGLAGVPHSYELMERCGLLANLPASVTTLTQAGGHMAQDLAARVAEQARRTRARLFIMYGQTEATARIAYLRPELVPRYPGAIGQAIQGGELWLENEDGTRVVAGAPGELIYRGPNVMMGYANERKSLADPPGSDVLRTGDLATEVEPGIFRVIGRKSRFVKPYGLRIGLDDLEARLRKAGVQAVVAGDDALIVIAAATEADLDTSRQALRSLGLPDDIFSFVQLPEMPRLFGGKIDYSAILSAGRSHKSPPVLVRTAPIETVAEYYRRLARGAPLADTDSFDSLNGDSLSYVQCSIAIEEALGEVPDGWEKLSLARLRALARSNILQGSATWRLMSLESDIVVRCLAITQILFQHALGNIQGGADLLMMLSGFTWARFQQGRLVAGGSRGAFMDFIRRYLLIYLGIMFAVFVMHRKVVWSHLLFISTFRGDWGGILNIYWFFESLTWCVAAICFAFAVPAIREFAAQRPTFFSLTFVGVALAIRLIGGVMLDAAAHVFRSPDQMLIYFAAGWAIALAGWQLRLALFVMLATISAMAWGWNDAHVAAMLVAAGLIVFVRRVSMPRPVGRAVGTIAAASFYIYLFNVFPMYLTDIVLQAKFGKFWLFQIVASLALGIAVSFLLSRSGKLWGVARAWAAPIGRRKIA